MKVFGKVDVGYNHGKNATPPPFPPPRFLQNLRIFKYLKNNMDCTWYMTTSCKRFLRKETPLYHCTIVELVNHDVSMMHARRNGCPSYHVSCYQTEFRMAMYLQKLLYIFYLSAYGVTVPCEEDGTRTRKSLKKNVHL